MDEIIEKFKGILTTNSEMPSSMMTTNSIMLALIELAEAVKKELEASGL